MWNVLFFVSMKGLYKFIFAAVGYWISGSIWGAIAGFIFGNLLDSAQLVTQNQQNRGAGGRDFSSDDLFQFYQQRSQTNDFPTMLMALSAAVMKADNKVVKAELNYVKAFFQQQFGPQFSTQHLQTLKSFLDASSIPLHQICRDIQMRLQPEVRVQLIHYLFGIAKADGNVSTAETNVIERISNWLGITTADFQSVKNMFYRDAESDYKILDISPNASDDEVKKAYRKMAIKYHPDKVAQMGADYETGAKEKFQSVQAAYENIKKKRSLS